MEIVNANKEGTLSNNDLKLKAWIRLFVVWITHFGLPIVFPSKCWHCISNALKLDSIY